MNPYENAEKAIEWLEKEKIPYWEVAEDVPKGDVGGPISMKLIGPGAPGLFSRLDAIGYPSIEGAVVDNEGMVKIEPFNITASLGPLRKGAIVWEIAKYLFEGHAQ